MGRNKKNKWTCEECREIIRENKDNIFDVPYSKLVKIRLEKNKCRYMKDIVTHLMKAFDNLTIEIYTEVD